MAIKTDSSNPMTRFEQFKAKYAQADEFSQSLFRLHNYFDRALEEFSSRPTRERDWKNITANAQKLLDNMPEAEGAEAVLTVGLFLMSLDNHA